MFIGEQAHNPYVIKQKDATDHFSCEHLFLFVLFCLLSESIRSATRLTSTTHIGSSFKLLKVKVKDKGAGL